VLLQEIEQRSLGYFDQEVQKLDAWADDLKLGLVQDIENLDQEIKEVRRKAVRAMTLAEKVSLQKQQREMDSKLKKMRQELFVQQDRIDERRGALIGELEEQLRQVVRERILFTIQWVIT
jgi:possible helicase (snf2/rad54 family)